MIHEEKIPLTSVGLLPQAVIPAVGQPFGERWEGFPSPAAPTNMVSFQSSCIILKEIFSFRLTLITRPTQVHG